MGVNKAFRTENLEMQLGKAERVAEREVSSTLCE